MRLFAGIALPPSAVERLSQLQLRLAHPGDGLRWSLPDQWHITLCFLGDVQESVEPSVVGSLRELRSAGAEIVIDSLGLFPAKGILFAEVVPSPSLLELQRAVQSRLEAVGFQAESRPFRPHITLARSKGRAGQTTLGRLSKPAMPAFGPELRWQSEEVLLYESVLGPHGAQYRVKARFPLLVT